MEGIWTILSITIGAGVIALPFVVAKAGFLTGVLVIIVLGLLMILVNLYLGEILLRTRIRHQISGLAEIYLGKIGKPFMMIFNALSLYGALVAYIIGAGASLHGIFGGNELIFSIIFFILLSIVIFFGINFFAKVEFILNPLKIIFLLVLVFSLVKTINFSYLANFDFYKLLIPYGVVMFAFTSFSAIPEMNQEIKNKINLKKAIIIGGILTILLYLLFVFAVVGSLDGNVQEVSTTSFNIIGKNASLFANLFALLAMTTAFVGLGFALKDNFKLDYRLPNWLSWLLVISIPFFLFIFNLGNFIFFLEISGAVAIGIMLFLILLMHSRSKKKGDRKPEYELKDNLFIKGLIYILILIGIIYVLIGYF